MRPVENKILRDRVADAIRHAIVQGTLRPGQRVIERELADELQVSRLPIREAIRMLEHEGLIISVPRKGTFIVEITDNDIVEIFSLRAALEGLAARLVTQRASQAEIASLQRLVDDMAVAGARRNIPRLWEIDTRFHTSLCQLAANSRLLKHWELLFTQWQAIDSLTDQVHPLEQLPDGHPMAREIFEFPNIHQGLVTALASGDPQHAEQTMRDHIARAQRNTLAIKALADSVRSPELHLVRG